MTHLPVCLLELLQHPTGHRPAVEKVGASPRYSTVVTLPPHSCVLGMSPYLSKPQFAHVKTGCCEDPAQGVIVRTKWDKPRRVLTLCLALWKGLAMAVIFLFIISSSP